MYIYIEKNNWFTYKNIKNDEKENLMVELTKSNYNNSKINKLYFIRSYFV